MGCGGDDRWAKCGFEGVGVIRFRLVVKFWADFGLSRESSALELRSEVMARAKMQGRPRGDGRGHIQARLAAPSVATSRATGQAPSLWRSIVASAG